MLEDLMHVARKHLWLTTSVIVAIVMTIITIVYLIKASKEDAAKGGKWKTASAISGAIAGILWAGLVYVVMTSNPDDPMSWIGSKRHRRQYIVPLSTISERSSAETTESVAE